VRGGRRREAPAKKHGELGLFLILLGTLASVGVTVGARNEHVGRARVLGEVKSWRKLGRKKGGLEERGGRREDREREMLLWM
jgi:hypothetical protein